MPKISSLSIEATVINSTDWFVVEQSGITKKARGAIVGGGGGGGGGSFTKIEVNSQSLGGISAGAFTFCNVTSVAQRGFVSYFHISPSAKNLEYDIEIYDAGSQTTNKMLLAYGATGDYIVSAPWYMEVASGGGSTMRIGIRNKSTITVSYYLNKLRVEQLG